MNKIPIYFLKFVFFPSLLLILSCHKDKPLEDAQRQVDNLLIDEIESDLPLIHIVDIINKSIKGKTRHKIVFLLDNKTLNTSLSLAASTIKEHDPFNPKLVAATMSQLNSTNQRASLCDWIVTICYAYGINSILIESGEIVLVPKNIERNFGININECCVSGRVIWLR